MLQIFHRTTYFKQSLISFPLQFNTLKLLVLDLFLVIMRLQQKILKTPNFQKIISICAWIAIILKLSNFYGN